ncbi:early boundary activity protein 3 [Drosophila tropicalis]|uniref:early boundary activity protein 3 n=1 Tax=Drosophila tropicalis TaxID=46794 RepID=UPI0035ABBEB8
MSNISNDSGLDDSAVAVVNAAASQNGGAATRLSWFLAEVDEGSMKSGRPSGQSRLCVLHSMELLESDVSDKYMTRFVEFRVNGMVVEAKLILAADDRKLVDAALVTMSKVRREESNARQLLVQYTENEELVQKLISPSRVVWLSTKPELGGTPLVKLGPGCIAHVLYAYDQRDYMEKILLNLKARCFDHAFDDKIEDTSNPLDENTWLLVQFSTNPETVGYRVIQYQQTMWRNENLFKDVIAYIQLPGTDIVLQAVVISYGQDRAKQQAKLDELRSFALGLNFPVPEELDKQIEQGQGTASLFTRTSSSIFQRAEQRDANGEHKELRHSLAQMSEKAESEAKMIIEAFDILDNINKNLQNRLDVEAMNNKGLVEDGAQ